MEKPLRILFAEDNKSDVEIAKRLITKAGISFVDRVVESKEDFIEALSELAPDIILCDYSMPRFDGMRALLLRQELAPLIPFILVTGSINEEVAVECMKAGADDYVIKQNIIRLVPAIKAALLKQETIRLRIEAEAALRISEERFKQIAELAGEFIWEVDSNGLYTYVNKISEGILGYSAEEIVGKKHFYDFFVVDLAEEMKTMALQSFKEKKGFKNFENPNVHKDGHIVILSTTGMPVLDIEGNLLGYRGVDTDITEQKNAEKALRDSEERFRNLYSNMGEGVCLQKLVFDYAGKAVDYRIISVNHQYENILNIRKDDVLGKLATEIYGVGFPPYLFEYHEVVTTGLPYTFETFYSPMNKYFRISVSPWDKDGFATIFTDITDRIKSEETIRQERLLLRTLIDHIPDTIYVKDAEGRKIIANPADLGVIGVLSEADVIGKTDLETFPDETGRRGYNDDLEIVKTGKPVLNREEDFVDGDGQHRWLLTTKVPLTDEHGTVTGLVGIGHDITSRKHSEEQIRLKVKELAASNEELTRFNRLAIGREMRMIELKQHCNRLATQLGIAAPYNLDFLKQDFSISGDKPVPPIHSEKDRKNADTEKGNETAK